jgi:predicted O-linked N-acetylglucosamine transferase (SPINDLY family)
MDRRLAAAQAALQDGRADEAIQTLIALLGEAPDQAAGVYFTLGLQLYRKGRHAEAETWVAAGVRRFPRHVELLNLHGVLLRRLGRWDAAVATLNAALRLQPKNTSAMSNLANVLLDSGDAAGAEAVLTKLVRLEPKASEHQRLLGRALVAQSRHEGALPRFRQAILLDRNRRDAWFDLIGLLMEMRRDDEAAEALERAGALFPGDPKLAESRIVALRRRGRSREAEAELARMVEAGGAPAWAYHQLAATVADSDRPRANELLRRAVELEPGAVDIVFALAESLQRTRRGDEAAHIEESYQVIRKAPGLHRLSARNKKVASEIFLRVGAYEELARLGSFAELGRAYAAAGLHAGLMNLLAQVRSKEDRRALVDFHRLWGQREESLAANDPIVRKPPAVGRAKLRIGFMSSDLRAHPVGAFTMPLLKAYDRSRFEVYCYSYKQGEADAAQQAMAGMVDAFRWRPDISNHDAAQMIADDQLDILIELGGSTYMNKLEVMAYKPAPLQASWLGYAHSAGPSTIDYLVLDPFMAPEDPALLIEKPLMLPHCWYSLEGAAYRDDIPLETTAPAERNGYVTFGTANNPYKYGPELLRSWARILARTPDSRFLFIRPEGGSPSFRANMTAAFAAEGVAPERVLFEPVRGRHLPHYNRLDMSLDTFPQTGGTTTCESLWMGAPVITLVGEALYERLSYSVLMNLGLGEFCTRSVEAYEDAAVALAADPARIGELRRSLRSRMRASPLGQTETWARDFFEAVAKAVAEAR